MCVNSILAIFGSTFSRHIHLAERWLRVDNASFGSTPARLRFR